jgi:hypothetical protein
MSKAPSTARKPKTPQPMAEVRQRHDYADMVRYANIVSSLRPTAAALILQGLFTIEQREVFAAAKRLADDEFNLAEKERVHERAVETLRGTGLSDEQTAALNELPDLPWLMHESSAEAGYLLGIAVGLQLQSGLFESLRGSGSSRAGR